MDVRDALDYIEDVYPDESIAIREAIKEKDEEIERLKRNMEIMLRQIEKYASIEDREIQAVIKAILNAIIKRVKEEGEH